MKYTEDQLKQMNKNILAVRDYLVDTFAFKLKDATDSIWATDKSGTRTLRVRGDGVVIYRKFSTSCEIRFDSKGRAYELIFLSDLLLNWHELKDGLINTWNREVKEIEDITWGFEL